LEFGNGAPFDGERVISSDHILEVSQVPGSLCIIGGGVIGIEFASLFARLGTKVTVLEMLPRIVAPAAGGDASAPFVECTGEGVVLIEEPQAEPPLAPPPAEG